jgi:4-carboxymuconolactone decarboxylase
MTDDDRRARGKRMFEEVNGFPVGDLTTPLTEMTIDHVFGEVWTRPGLTRKERRWIALSCAASTGSDFALRFHVQGALTSGDITTGEMREFVAQFAVYQGYPKASVLGALVEEIATTLP